MKQATAITSAILFFGISVASAAADDPSAKGIEFFEKKIRPMLAKHCYECHSAKTKKLKGGLLLDTREASRRGGESGHAVVPGNAEDSLLLSAIRYEGFEMPPDKQLPEGVIADFEKWISMGAPDPRDAKSLPIRREIDFEKGRQFWSFQPIRTSEVPQVADPSWPRSDIDRFLLARWEAKGIKPVVDASPQVLVRRVYFDLTGLPPTPQQLDDFVADPSPAAFSSLVDRLLESPQFGERWGRHWLDVVRFGESTGMERNFTFPFAWRYRDYVIKSFNDDTPYDQFIIEQVAGDLLPADNDEQRKQQLIATGMLAIGTKSLNQRDKEKFMMDLADEQIDVTTQSFMALTASCARCHDHKFDPIPQKEYYALAGIFCSTDTFYGTGGNRGNRQSGKLLEVGSGGVRPVSVGGSNAKNSKSKKALAVQIKVAQKRLLGLRKQAKRNAAAKKRLAKAEAQMQQLQAQLLEQNRQAERSKNPGDAAKATLVMAVQDGSSPSDTQLRIRGESDERGASVPRGFLTIASLGESPAIKPSDSGRMQFAHWLTREDNPLTARVAVNRIWQHLFGRGIVATVNNFGENGARPTHPKLLDYLATTFVENEWSMKQQIRKIMNSRVYQLSNTSNADAEAIDPSNELVWKMNQRRLEVEAIRDAMLAASGQLDLTPGKGSIVESIGDGDIGRNIPPERFNVPSVKRSVYLPVVRGAVPTMLQVFDFPDPSIIVGQRTVTTVPTQALYMMNSQFMLEQSRYFARRILAEDQLDQPQQIDFAYRLAVSRYPTSQETDEALRFLKEVTDSFQEEQSQSEEAQLSAWAAFCQALLASSEFRYVN